MSPEERQDWQAYQQNQDAAAHQRLCERYLPQVKYIVHRMAIYIADGVMDREDLYQAGVIGLIEAIEKYDSSRQIEFMAFAQRRIRGAVYDELRALDGLSPRARRQKRQMDKVKENLKHKFLRLPTEAETAEALGVSLERFRHLQATLELSRTRPGEEEQDNAVAEKPPAAHFQHWLPEADGLSPAEKFRILAGKIDQFPERVKIVLGLYYREGLTLKEIAEVLQVTESRVCQIHGWAIENLQNQFSEIGDILANR